MLSTTNWTRTNKDQTSPDLDKVPLDSFPDYLEGGWIIKQVSIYGWNQRLGRCFIINKIALILIRNFFLWLPSARGTQVLVTQCWRSWRRFGLMTFPDDDDRFLNLLRVHSFDHRRHEFGNRNNKTIHLMNIERQKWKRRRRRKSQETSLKNKLKCQKCLSCWSPQKWSSSRRLHLDHSQDQDND